MKIATSAGLILAMLAAPLLVGCSGDETAAAPVPPPRTPTGLAVGWNELSSEDAMGTACNGGEDYKFFVRPGSVNRLAIVFTGGSIAFDDISYDNASASIGQVSAVASALDAGSYAGMFDETQELNPIADWWVVVAPDCTGDSHLGDALASYMNGSVNHRGAVNARSMIDWVFAGFERPETILVTGLGSGALGSLVWSTHVIDQFPDSAVRQLGDSGAFVGVGNFFIDMSTNWDIAGALPSGIDGLDPTTTDYSMMTMADFTTLIAGNYPEQRFGQYNSSADQTQADFYGALMMGDTMEWLNRLGDSLLTITEGPEDMDGMRPGTGLENFSFYVAQTDVHIMTTNGELYEAEEEAYPLISWMRDFVDAPNVPIDASCDPCEEEMMPQP